MKGSLKKDFYVNNHLYEPRSDFHRAVVKLVEKMDLQLLDTSSESGYGSDQDSLNNLVNLVKTTTLAYAIAVPELLYMSAQIWSEQVNVPEMMVVLLISYVAIVGLINQGMQWLETRLRVPGFGQ